MAKESRMELKNQGSIVLNKNVLRGVTIFLFVLAISSVMIPLVTTIISPDSSIDGLLEDNKAEVGTGEATFERKIPTPLDPVGTDDSYEPNDNLGEAPKINIGSRLENLAASGNDEDWFYCEIPTAQWGVGLTLMIEIQYNPGETDFDLEVGDRNQDKIIICSNSSGSTDSVRIEILPTVSLWKEYYARIHVAPEKLNDPSYISSQLYTYNFSIFLEDRFGDSFYWYNNDTSNARDIPSTDNPTDFYDPLTLSGLIRVNDCFRFLAWDTNEIAITVGGDLPGGVMFETSGALNPGEGLRATILRPDLTQIASQFWSSSNQTTIDAMSFTANVSGYYYLQLNFNTSASSVASQAMYNFTLDIDDSLDGVSHASSSFATASMLRKGLAFDGVNDEAIVPDSPELRLQTEMTIELWLKTSTTHADVARLVGKGGSTDRNYGVWIHPDGRILWQISYGGSNYVDLYSITAVKDGSWHHIAATYNGSYMVLYIDGLLEASLALAQTPDTSSADLIMGYGPPYDHYNGLLDEVRIISWPLTAAMIREDYTSSPSYPARTGTAAWYQFTESSGITINDYSGNNNNGTIYGGASLAFSEETIGLWTSSPYPDYYNVSLHKNEILDLSAEFIHGMGDINLYLYNDSGKSELIRGSTSHTDKEQISTFFSPRDATYYLFLNSSILGQRYYNLSFAIRDDDVFEENDFLLDPAPLSAKNSTYALFLDKSESDYFKIDLGYQDFLNVTIILNGSLGNLDITLYDAISGDILEISNHSSGNQESVTWFSPLESSLIIKVYAPFGGGISSVGIEYQLIVTIVPGDDRFEDNDEQENAYLIGEVSVRDLIVRNTDPDYYMVYLLQNEPLQVDVAYSYAHGNIDLWILDEEGTPIAKEETLTDDESASSIAPADGVYYIHVLLANGTVNFYNLTISYDEKDESPPHEDNDHPGQALTLQTGDYFGLTLRWGDPDYYGIPIPSRIQAVSILAEFNRTLGNLTITLFMPNGTFLAAGETFSNTTESIDLSAASLPFPGTYSLKVILDNSSPVAPIIYDMHFSRDLKPEVNTTISPISTIPFPHPSREFFFLSSDELDPVLLSTIFVGGIGAGAVIIVILRRRYNI